jgi:hypothetical protein
MLPPLSLREKSTSAPNETESEPCAGRSRYSSASASYSTPPASKAMRHRAALANAHHCESSATQIQSQWRKKATAKRGALTRMIFAEARKRHQGRATFQKRLEEKHVEGEPTLWRFSQCRQILREALNDVLAAVKVCSAAERFQGGIAGSEEETSHCMLREKIHLHMPQLSAISFLNRRLSDTRAAESEWCKLTCDAEIKTSLGGSAQCADIDAGAVHSTHESVTRDFDSVGWTSTRTGTTVLPVLWVRVCRKEDGSHFQC